MLGSEMLETIIGIIFVFLLVSIICTAVREWIESMLKTRAAFLEYGIRELLHDRDAIGLTRLVYTHPLINGLYQGDYKPRPTGARPSALTHGGTLPTYIPTRNFALALMDIAARGPANAVGSSDGTSPQLTLANVRANVLNLENAPVQRVLLTAIDTARGDLDKAVANIAAWYDSGMDRVSGAYKRATQKLLFFVGLIVAIALNVNPLKIADYLYRNDAARAAVVARAEAAAKDTNYVNGTNTRSIGEVRASLDSLRLPIGWAGSKFSLAAPKENWKGVFSPLLGWIIAALAATLGAPFWFDMLNKVMVVRSTVKPHEKSPEESSEDKQTTASKEKIAAGDVGSGAPAVGAKSEALPLAQGASPPQGGAPPAPSMPKASPTPAHDPEADFDGCDVEAEAAKTTTDEDLPAATGGVA